MDIGFIQVFDTTADFASLYPTAALQLFFFVSSSEDSTTNGRRAGWLSCGPGVATHEDGAAPSRWGTRLRCVAPARQRSMRTARPSMCPELLVGS